MNIVQYMLCSMHKIYTILHKHFKTQHKLPSPQSPIVCTKQKIKSHNSKKGQFTNEWKAYCQIIYKYE